MTRAAVALETKNPGATARGRSSFRLRRLHFVLIGIAIVAVWLVFVFARALGDLDRATARQQGIAAEAAALEARLDADHRELTLVQTDAFQSILARSYGMGGPGEMIFTLPQDAPAPPPIAPLGATGPSGSTTTEASPLDAWLLLLFGN